MTSKRRLESWQLRVFEQELAAHAKSKAKSVWLAEEGVEQGCKMETRLFDATLHDDG